jgi:hypothetical protein
MRAICRACHREVEWRDAGFSAWGEAVDRPRAGAERSAERGAGARVATMPAPISRRMTVAEIVAILDRRSRACSTATTLGAESGDLLPIVTGYDPEMVRLGLTGYLKTFRAPQLQRFLARISPIPSILDAFQPAMKGGFAEPMAPICCCMSGPAMSRACRSGA